MFRLDADRPVEFCDGLRSRGFLHAWRSPCLASAYRSSSASKPKACVCSSNTNLRVQT